MMENPIRVIHYPRVSSQKQAKEGDSIESQDKRLTAHSTVHNDIVIGTYTDSGKSASIPDDKMNISYKDGKLRVIIDISKREGMVKILDEVGKDKWDAVKFTMWDRFSRNSFVSKIVQIYLARFKKLLIPIEDSNDPLWKDIRGAMSEDEVRRLTKRVRDTRVNRFDKGILPGRSPFGYEPIMRDKKVVGFKPKKKEADIVKDIFKLTAEGMGYKEVCEKYKGKIPRLLKGKIKMGDLEPQSYYNIIRNKVYIGVVIFEGKENKGVHEPLIDESLFLKCNNK